METEAQIALSNNKITELDKKALEAVIGHESATCMNHYILFNRYCQIFCSVFMIAYSHCFAITSYLYFVDL
jgi:hypothetical protein